MKNLKLILSAVVLASFTSCVNDDTYGIPDLSKDCVSIAKTKEVTDVTNIATSAVKQYTTDESVTDYMEAYVTSSDEGGNFYKTISMMSLDGTKGFSMPVDNYNLYAEFEPGRKVTVKLDKNTFFNVQHGSTVIGASYNNGVGRISGVEYKNVILRSCDDVNEDDIVKNLTIAQAKNNQYLNMLIEFDVVQFTDPSLGKNYFDASLNSIGGATNHTLRDANGNTVIVRVSEYAKFAGKKIPTGSGKLRGVMTKYNSDFQFMIRTEEDVKLTEDRFVPVNPNNPTPPTNLFFGGSNFETWSNFTASINSFGLKTYAVQGVGAGAIAGNSLHLNGTPTANDYVFTILASAKGTMPANPSTITFWVKGTSGKSLSLNVYRGTAGTTYDVFNVGSLGSNAVTLTKAPIQTAPSVNGTNSYTGSIDTDGQWVKVTLDISDVQINTTNAGDIFALKVGSNAAYNLHIDNIEIH
jgi:hypothetical protein